MSTRDGVKPPWSWHTLEFMFAAVFEVDAGATHQIDDGARDKDLATLCQRDDPSGNVDRQPSNVVTAHLDFAGVEAHAYIDPKLAGSLADRAPTLDCASGTVERDEEPVAHGLDFPALEASELTTYHCVMCIEPVLPRPIAEGRRPPG